MTHATLTSPALLDLAVLALTALEASQANAGTPQSVRLRGRALRALQSAGLTEATANRLVERNA